MKVLISGFEAFGEEKVNPTALLIEALKKNEIPIPDGLLIKAILLPVTFADSFTLLSTAIEDEKPDIILSFGVASGRDAIELERVAINCMDAKIPDNKGHRPQDEWIHEKGEAALFLRTFFTKNREQALRSSCSLQNL